MGGGVSKRESFRGTSRSEISRPSADKVNASFKIPKKHASFKQKSSSSKLVAGISVQDRYVFGDTLGEGSFAIVHQAAPTMSHRENFAKAHHRDLPESVAIKRINKNPDVSLANITKEIDMLQTVQCEYVTEFFESYETSKYFYLCLELADGGELFDYIIEKDFLSEQEAAEIIQQVVSGLLKMHTMCVVHRDVKPENILLVKGNNSNHDERPKVKLTDLGLAEKISHSAAEDLFEPCGTPGYVAPEILKRQKYGAKVDVWSVGVILYILLCGFPPFYSDDQEELFRLIKNGALEFDEEYWFNISRDAKDTISNILVVDPQQRVGMKDLLSLTWIRDASQQSQETLGKHVVQGIDVVRRNKHLKKVTLAISVVSAFRTSASSTKPSASPTLLAKWKQSKD